MDIIELKKQCKGLGAPQNKVVFSLLFALFLNRNLFALNCNTSPDSLQGLFFLNYANERNASCISHEIVEKESFQ